MGQGCGQALDVEEQTALTNAIPMNIEEDSSMNKRLMPYYLMTVPAVVLFFVFLTLPALQGVYYSFTNWNGFGDHYDFIGIKNYVNLFKDGNVGNAYWFTFKFAVVVTILINILSLLIAMGLNAKIKARNFFGASTFCRIFSAS